jgi:hypothetical protein
MPKVQPIGDHAIANLRYIRETMERSAAFTAVPGWAGVAIGLTALAAAWIASRQTTAEMWLAVWLAEGMIALGIGIFGILEKVQRTGVPLTSARKFALGFAPPIAVAVALSAAMWNRGLADFLPGAWISLYGAAVIAGGAYSVGIVPVMGTVFLAIGSAALFAPPAWADALMALSFGGVHIVFGLLVARRYGG